ncbi:unnamed protein product [Rotaria sordida]|uniref:Uncharacterized protein n=1 Tax=Rotaria sordida TaxID=392033 RepID=A0A814NDI7_9BILA|nr:unnamed protein product [Rotaria sordida]
MKSIFTVDNENGDTFVLKNEIFKELKPADQEVSRFKHRSTPLVLRATAETDSMNKTTPIIQQPHSTGDNFPKSLRGGGFCFIW